jgi:hypothetical protein
MKISREVILDLLPIYSSGEASDDTNRLVREYLASDPDLARLAEEIADINLPDDMPVTLTWEDKMKAYREAKRLLLLRTIILAGIISFSVLAILGLGAVAVMFFVR